MADKPEPLEGPYWESARRRAEELAAVFAADQVVTEAELAAKGIYPVSVAHGSPETDEAAALIFEVLPRLARECGTLTATRGGNEYTTYLFAGPGADAAAVAFMARVLAVAPRWWRITAMAYPVWCRDQAQLNTPTHSDLGIHGK